MKYYPIAIRLKNKNAVVVGGGNVAERKVQSLLKVGAGVTIISPVLTAGLAALAEKNKISWVKNKFRPVDINKAQIIIAATSDRRVNKKLSNLARSSGKLINVVDDKKLSDFISPAVIRKQKAIIAVYTDGKEPELSRDLKNFLEGHWDEFLLFRNRS